MRTHNTGNALRSTRGRSSMVDLKITEKTNGYHGTELKGVYTEAGMYALRERRIHVTQEELGTVTNLRPCPILGALTRDLKKIAEKMNGCYGAELKGVYTEAGMYALRERRIHVTQEELGTATNLRPCPILGALTRDLKKIAEKMNGCYGAELKGVYTEAGMYVLRERRIHVTQEDLNTAANLRPCPILGALTRDLKKIAEKMNGCYGAELKGVYTEAGMYALRERRIHVTQEDLNTAANLRPCPILGVLTRDLKKIAEKMNGCYGAELKGVYTEAGMYALRERRIHVTQEDLNTAANLFLILGMLTELTTDPATAKVLNKHDRDSRLIVSRLFPNMLLTAAVRVVGRV